MRDDFPNHKLRRGDVATIVEHHRVANGEDGYSLEVFNAIGETNASGAAKLNAVLVVSEAQIEPLMRNEVLHIRVLGEAV